MHIVAKHPYLAMEEKIYYPGGGYGKADIINLSTGEIWEVKFCGKASLAADNQLSKYLTGTYSHNEQMHKTRKGKMSIAGEFTTGNLKVTYWTSRPGVILYSFDFENKETALAVVPERESAALPVGGINRATLAGQAFSLNMVSSWAYSYVMGRNATQSVFYACR